MVKSIFSCRWWVNYFLILTLITRHCLCDDDEGDNGSDEGVDKDREELPKEEDALSLWLITRTGWVFCERMTEYMKKSDKDFDTSKCKKCYRTLFNKYKLTPDNVTDSEYLKCVENFGRSRPSFPSIGWPPTAVELIQQNPFESLAVQPYTCNSALTGDPPKNAPKSNRPRYRQLPLPSLRQFTQLLAVRGFSYKNDPKAEYPRREYVNCLLGALFETELGLCPLNTERRRCAAQRKLQDENLILSRNVPITYAGVMEGVQSRSLQYTSW